ncbi:urease accessory protein UreE [Desulfosporosinus sp. OT]|uniref:urease accessory protein UreE n=1 Tax=Desulfosporosinus sp. OT TaxID=913865 RepID=UPI000223A1AB|nr:urease accessory protein UreE [Desulfosporosinus sp. OT]EGW37911.1 ureE urease accessory, N-terminal domain protein [Desulfosporosinus sp. OT]
MIVTKVIGKLADLEQIYQHEKETFTIEQLHLSWDELQKRILRKTTDVGRDIGIQLESGHLHPGDILYREENHLIVVKVKEEAVLVVPVGNMREMGLAAHAIGNMHAPIELKSDCVITPYNQVLQEQLAKLGLYPVKEAGAFAP